MTHTPVFGPVTDVYKRQGFDRVKGDQMGMLATVINSLGLSSALGAAGVKARVLTAIRMEPIGDVYKRQG